MNGLAPVGCGGTTYGEGGCICAVKGARAAGGAAITCGGGGCDGGTALAEGLGGICGGGGRTAGGPTVAVLEVAADDVD